MSIEALNDIVEHMCNSPRPCIMQVDLVFGASGWQMIFTFPDKIAALTIDEADLLAAAILAACHSAPHESSAGEMFGAGIMIGKAVEFARRETASGSIH